MMAEGKSALTVTLTINDTRVTAQPGDSVLDAARKAGVYIPSLCYDPDLRPAGACRLCIAEIDGFRGLQTCCTTPATEGMVVRTETPWVDEVRRGIIELALSEHPADCLVCAKNQRCALQTAAAYAGIRGRSLPRLERPTTIDSSNPFFERDPEKCVLCGICVRACQSIQGVGAIDFVGRGSATRVATFGDGPLAASTCASCGECLARCPTGALREKWVVRQPTREVNTTCSYCGSGCGITLQLRGNDVVGVKGTAGHPASQGALCVKGRFGHSWMNHADRLREPLIKKNGEFVEASWDEALDLIAERFAANVGRFAAIGSARCSNEEAYVVQKFARLVMNTNSVDNSART